MASQARHHLSTLIIILAGDDTNAASCNSQQPQPQSIAENGRPQFDPCKLSNICQHLEKENLKPIYGSLVLAALSASWCNNNKIAENYTFRGNFLQPD